MLSTGLPKLGKKHEKCDPRILSRLKPRAITVDMLPRSLAASIRRKPLPKDIPALSATNHKGKQQEKFQVWLLFPMP